MVEINTDATSKKFCASKLRSSERVCADKDASDSGVVDSKISWKRNENKERLENYLYNFFRRFFMRRRIRRQVPEKLKYFFFRVGYEKRRRHDFS